MLFSKDKDSEKHNEAHHDQLDYPDHPPPAYEDVAPQSGQNKEQYPPNSNQPGLQYDGKQLYPSGPAQNYGPPQPKQQYQPSNPMDDPNVYKVKPQMVNIAQANPEHLNPSYPQYMQNEQRRNYNGDFPKQYKHGAPLAPGKTDSNNKTGGKSFPGRGGATYNNAANR